MHNDLFNEVITKYILGVKTDRYHRYVSWDHCYKAFYEGSYNPSLPLQLGFYLASWGMYRGSGGLLQKNHLIHEGSAKIVLQDEFKAVKCSSSKEVDKSSIPAILRLKDALSLHYRTIKFDRGVKVKDKPISNTDTLISKVILGTLACAPAYDRYFLAGIKEEELKHSKFNAASLNELFDFADENKSQITAAQNLIKVETGNHYPVMKIIDMYFWQLGYDAENTTT